jgi:hypothetical protein
MEPWLILSAGVLGGCVVAGVLGTILFRRSAAKPVVDVDDLAVELERVSKLVRKLTMSNLRRSALDAPEPLPPGQPVLPAAPRPLTKDEIRARVFGGNR